MTDVTTSIHEPFDLIRLSLSERVLVKLRGDREMRGILHAYDGHMNLILGDVEETIYDMQVSEDTGAESIQVCLFCCIYGTLTCMLGREEDIGNDVCAGRRCDSGTFGKLASLTHVPGISAQDVKLHHRTLYLSSYSSLSASLSLSLSPCPSTITAS